MKLRLLCLVALCFSSLLGSSQTEATTPIFVECEALNVENYAQLKTAFNQSPNLELESICLGAQVLCISGMENPEQLWQLSERLLKETFPSYSAVWKSEMTEEAYLALSKSYRLKSTTR